MDWLSWLSKTSLEASMVYEYSVAFGNNELEEEDIAYFNHEFLQSMGISIAKHRLEILKLARREHKPHALFKHPMSKLFLVLKKTKKCLSNYISTLVHKDDHDHDRSLIVVPRNKNNNKKGSGAISYSSRWRKSMMIRNTRKLVMVNDGNNQDKLMMITNGDYLGDVCDDSLVVSTPKLHSFSTPFMYDIQQNKEEKVHDDVDDDQQEDEYWSPVVEEIKWDAMFQDLNPT